MNFRNQKSFNNIRYGNTNQITLKRSTHISGLGVHSGQPVSIILHPAKSNSGIIFLRKGSKNNSKKNVDPLIPAHYNFVSSTNLCTVLGDPTGVFVATVEHLLAALRGLGIDNVLIEIDGSEVPILDGSANGFVDQIEQAGFKIQSAIKRIIRVLRPIKANFGKSYAELQPFDGCYFDVRIDFDSSVIGQQHFAADLTPNTFKSEISCARTFGFLSDVKKLHQAGYALGSSLDNSVVIDGDKILNKEGLRFEDEFVRHKMLDAIGDLALAGAPLFAKYISVCGGHKLNFLILKELFSSPDNWCFEEVVDDKQYKEHIDIPINFYNAKRSVANEMQL